MYNRAFIIQTSLLVPPQNCSDIRSTFSLMNYSNRMYTTICTEHTIYTNKAVISTNKLIKGSANQIPMVHNALWLFAVIFLCM